MNVLPKAVISCRANACRTLPATGCSARPWRIWFLLLLSALASHAGGEVPSLLNYQGRLVIGTTAFDGTGRFKLALINADGSQVYWRNAPDANNDGEPDNSVAIPVNRGIYSVALGDTALASMAALPPNVFVNSAVYLRVWFNDGVNGFQRLTPDQRVTTAGYAQMAATVSDGSVTTAKLAPDLAAQIESLASRLAAVESSTGSGLTVVSTDPQDPNLTAKGFVTFATSPAQGWVVGPTSDALTARTRHSAIWTGQEMIVWGGAVATGTYSESGSIYRPDLDT